jgi:hypothetical protein
MRTPFSVKLFAFTTRNSLQEIWKKVKGKVERNLRKFRVPGIPVE